MPVVIFPVPEQLPQGVAPTRPDPWHTGQIFSPVPGVPAGASSPGLSGPAPLDEEGLPRFCDVFAMTFPLRISDVGCHRAGAFAFSARRAVDDAAAPASPTDVFSCARRARNHFVAGFR